MKTKLGYLRDTQYYYTDKCVVCGDTFENSGEYANQPMFCHKDCSAKFRDNPQHYKELYKEQFNKRGQERGQE